MVGSVRSQYRAPHSNNYMNFPTIYSKLMEQWNESRKRYSAYSMEQHMGFGSKSATIL